MIPLGLFIMIATPTLAYLIILAGQKLDQRDDAQQQGEGRR